ncbi:hypothetical protein EDD16DRAFT_1478013 [Pisolithus croceorrhizus]|nr:hypothetical protein EV401DRAFT_1876871 [Pisolithus croceorrhizus]KAI6121000.1 hypothetical protein EDD16DRAFT_1478013 [Pisolithus croceorrhizus]KAI6152739.1 hypothetical protein EDD17DRAFT_1490999 [Pisolithus thermaeus]
MVVTVHLLCGACKCSCLHASDNKCHYSRSTCNSCIECLWVEVGMQFACHWQAFFTQLKNQHMLDPCSPNHLWLPHMLFLDAVNADHLEFQQNWNCHLISGPNTNNKSPNICQSDICFLGQTEFGLYRDDGKGTCMYITDKYYGTAYCHLTHQRCTTGAADEEASDDKEHATLEAQTTKLVRIQQQQHAHKGPVHVPSHQTPFINPEDFFGVLQEVISQNIVPDGFGVTSEEWEAGQYPIFKTIQVGRWQPNQLEVSLAGEIWYNLACLWCQVLFCLMYFTENGLL